MRGAQARSWTADDVAESYAQWWRDAGLHSVASAEPHGWLAHDAATPPAPAPTTEARAPVQRVADAPVARPIPAPASRTVPGDLAAFIAWLGDEAQPEAAWHGALFPPSAQSHARLLVISDMPDDGASQDSSFAAPASRLIDGMLGAIGLQAGEAAFASLALRRPPGGLLDEETLEILTGRMRHYLALARPQAVLILGDRTSRALLAAQEQLATGRLPEIHHIDGTVPAAAIAGTELLMRRPMAKAASWQTLRLLHGTLNA